MAGPIRIGPRYLGGRKAAEQNRTSLHVWKPLKRWGSYLLADAVGTGKSYIALSVALGLFRKRERRPFRLLILAGPVELGQSWFDKVAGRHGRSVGTLAAEAGEDSFLEMYWGKRRRPEFVTYQLRRRWDLEALEDKLSSEETPTDERKLFTPGGSGPHGRVEVLIATPKLIAHLSRRGIEGQWRRWVARADFVIADEVFGARNESTIYGHLLREGGEEVIGAPRRSLLPWAVDRRP